MSPDKVKRERVRQLTDLPNIGPAMARDFERLGIRTPAQLAGADPYGLYVDLCRKTGKRQDPCVLDVFLSVVDFMDGGEPAPWWTFTGYRKRHYGRLNPSIPAART